MMIEIAIGLSLRLILLTSQVTAEFTIDLSYTLPFQLFLKAVELNIWIDDLQPDV